MGLKESGGADLERTKNLPLGHPAEATPPFQARLSISLCIFRLVSHLNTYAYLICHGFASRPCSKGTVGGGEAGIAGYGE